MLTIECRLHPAFGQNSAKPERGIETKRNCLNAGIPVRQNSAKPERGIETHILYTYGNNDIRSEQR